MADEVKIPTDEDIRQLPRWARVAFAARCARRVQPLFSYFWAGAPKEHVRAVEGAINAAVQSARDGVTVAVASEMVWAARTAGNVADIEGPGDGPWWPDLRPGSVACAASSAGRAAIHFDDDAEVISCVSVVALNVAQLLLEDASLIAADFRLLLQKSHAEKWTSDTPVTPEVFGPLWPDGVPKWWPVKDQSNAELTVSKTENAETFKLCIRAVAKPGIPADVIHHHAVELFKALNEYSLEKYGRRLTKDNFQRLVLECTGVGVPL